MLKSFQIFKESKQISRPWIYEGDFKVTEDMVKNGKMIKEKIPDEVTECFSCFNIQLTSLEGCPITVGGYLKCSNNLLSSLEGCPTKVNGYFDCSNNLLSSLEGCPSTVGGDFDCSNNQLTSLEGCPTTLNGRFDCSNNRLTSLEGCPFIIRGQIYHVLNNLDLSIEENFIKSGSCSSQSNYWSDLLKYMINTKIDLNKITTWPKGFLTPELINSVSGITKFNL